MNIFQSDLSLSGEDRNVLRKLALEMRQLNAVRQGFINLGERSMLRGTLRRIAPKEEFGIKELFVAEVALFNLNTGAKKAAGTVRYTV